MVVGFTTTCAVSASHHHYSCEFEPRSWRGVLDTTLCEKHFLLVDLVLCKLKTICMKYIP